jgi:hypothetical protein
METSNPLFKLKIIYLDKKEPEEEIIGTMDFENQKINIIDENKKWTGFIPFTSIKKVEIQGRLN